MYYNDELYHYGTIAAPAAAAGTGMGFVTGNPLLALTLSSLAANGANF